MGNRLSKIYTRTGDDGTTGLGDGTRVPKDSARVEAYGAVDELNSTIGVLLAVRDLPKGVFDCLTEIQHELFDLGGELCIPGTQAIKAEQVARLERELDAFNSPLPPLKDFILPGGGPMAAACHVARTVARRAERRVWTLGKLETVNSEASRYLNRLSDLLFVIARVLARHEHGSEVLWRHAPSPTLPRKAGEGQGGGNKESNKMNRAAVLGLIFFTGLACTGAFAADKKSQANERGQPLDRSGYFDKGAATTDDLRRVAMPAGFNEVKTSFVFKNARLFDGTGAPARNATVVVVGNKISKVLPPDSTDFPQEAEVIDAAGATVMPGLIDMHIHMTYVFDRSGPPELTLDSQADGTLRGMERLRYFVDSGITSVRDTASNGMAPFILKDWADQGQIPSPRVFPVGQLITGTGGHADELFIQRTAPDFEGSMIRTANGPDEWREAVRTQFKRGADWIKIASHFDEDEVQMAVKEAHQLGLRITVDSENVFTDMAVRAGVDCVEHPLPRSDETVRLMAARGIASIPTIVPYQLIIQNYGGYYGTTSRRFSLTEPHMFEMVKKMKDAGVKLGVGTDIVMSWYRRLPGPYIQELKNFERIGYKPQEALIAATRTNAEILGMADRLGTIEPGKLADLIIVDGKPDVNVEDLAKVPFVMVGGRVMKRDGRIEPTPRRPDPEEKAATNPRKMD